MKCRVRDLPTQWKILLLRKTPLDGAWSLLFRLIMLPYNTCLFPSDFQMPDLQAEHSVCEG